LITVYRIHSAIGIARVGNSEDFSPGQPDNPERGKLPIDAVTPGPTDTSPVVGSTRLNMVAVSCKNHSSYSNLERRRELCTAKAKCYL
jgi:hypothetical protein